MPYFHNFKSSIMKVKWLKMSDIIYGLRRFFNLGTATSIFILICLISASLPETIPVKSSISGCSCLRKITNHVSISAESNCDKYATWRGNGQKVVAYSYFGNSSHPRVRTHYLDQIADRVAEIQKYYPEWVMRIYYHLEKSDKIGHNLLCQMWCENANLDLCDIKNLPNLGDLQQIQPIGKNKHWLVQILSKMTKKGSLLGRHRPKDRPSSRFFVLGKVIDTGRAVLNTFPSLKSLE